jgi:hypothetical protein
MLTVSTYHVRETTDGRKFVALELTGGLEMIQSQVTGKFYASVKRVSVPSTFTEQEAQALVGSQLPGQIVKQAVEPYEYNNPRTGEVMMLNYSWAYQPTLQAEPVAATKVQIDTV